MQQHFFITCPKGIETLLLQELKSHNFGALKETVGGVFASGDFALVYPFCLQSRLANRVIWLLHNEPCSSKEQLFHALKDLPWSACFSANKTFAVDAKGQNKFIKNSQYAALLLKDAVCDHFQQEQGTRPDVDVKNADVRLMIRFKKQNALVGVDVSGGSLHLRGYRLQGAKAPLKENLAAALIKRLPNIGDAQEFYDPMCGSGTLLIEAVMAKLHIASQWQRKRFGFENLLRFDNNQWQAHREQATNFARQQIAAAKATGPLAFGFDSDMSVIAQAKGNIERAGLKDLIVCKQQALKDFAVSTEKNAVFLSNPPYGERLQDRERLVPLYQLLGQKIKAQCVGFQVAVLSSDALLLKSIGLAKTKAYRFLNGSLPVQWLLFDVYAPKDDKPFVEKDEKFQQAVSMVVNRLKKNRKKIEKWANKHDIHCYRLYDADMPEYAFALDNYQGRLQVTEYAAPKSVDEYAAFIRKQHFYQAVCDVFDIKVTQIFSKRRQQQKGEQQYQKLSESKNFFKVQEGQATLYVNLQDYLDTGLFLDHRPVRKMLYEKAQGKRFLNLFCYTAAASVQAALGGAKQSLSVDMSATYLQWAEKNFAVNRIDNKKHRVERADVLQWLDTHKDEYDLIFLDPPSFSNSKRMEDTLDIQRDHFVIVQQTMRRLAKGGELVFSNNRRKFALDERLLDIFKVENISAKTIDVDFERNPKIHQCWLITHK